MTSFLTTAFLRAQQWFLSHNFELWNSKNQQAKKKKMKVSIFEKKKKWKWVFWEHIEKHRKWGDQIRGLKDFEVSGKPTSTALTCDGECKNSNVPIKVLGSALKGPIILGEILHLVAMFSRKLHCWFISQSIKHSHFRVCSVWSLHMDAPNVSDKK